MAQSLCKSEFVLTNDTLYLALTGELWDVCLLWGFGRNIDSIIMALHCKRNYGTKLSQKSILTSRPRFNIKMSSYQYRKSYCGDQMVVRSAYLHNGISYTGKMTSLYWIRALISLPTCQWCPESTFNIKMSSYKYRDSHYKDKMVVKPSHLYNGNSYTGKMTSLYWIKTL